MHFPFLIIISTVLSVGFFPPIQGNETQPTSLPQSDPHTPAGILASAIQAVGGQRALSAITSFQLRGTMQLPDGPQLLNIELTTSHGGKVLCVITFIGVGESRFGSDGITAWEQNFGFDQSPTWSLIDQATLSKRVQQINWLEWFTMLPMYIDNMQFEGSMMFDGEECWILRIKEEHGRDQLAFFSRATHRPLGRRTIETTPDGDAKVDVYFRDWKRVGNLVLFHSVVYDRDGTQVILELEHIGIGDVSDDLFVLPDQVKKLRDTL